MDLKTLLLHDAGGVRTVTLNRPDRRNAMSLEMVRELRGVLTDSEADPHCRILVLRGSQGHFCSGGDVADMADAQARTVEGNDDPVAELSSQFGRLCVAYSHSKLALVAVLEGTVSGGGFGLACVADVALATPSAVFRLPETMRGLVPAQIAPYLIERLGYSEAKRIAVTGQAITADDALRIGLVHGVHAAGEAMDTALTATLGHILSCAPGALSATKALFLHARSAPPEKMIEEAALVFARAFNSPEGQEGTRAFLEKRSPSWAPRGKP
jgi:isohexenylglutaconyl-CoA hydratase